ncbi:hypothetical protein ACFRCW_23470 [Streptomyces sp. NPDC056653]|uniref:hypothetical protein n=1 Tax=Streptomyces sp. NPDC056653 TaxID=3345894 RepID=UPI0036B6649F
MRTVSAAARPPASEAFPFLRLAFNQAWPELCLTAIDLLAWMRSLLLDTELTTAEEARLPDTG